MANRKIYQVVLGYYDAPETEVVKTFSSHKKAEKFMEEYRKMRSFRDRRRDCIYIEDYEVE